MNIDPVDDDDEMSGGDGDGRAEVPPAARRFLAEAAAGRYAGGGSRTAQGMLDRLDRDGPEDDESDGDHEVTEQRAAVDGSELDAR